MAGDEKAQFGIIAHSWGRHTTHQFPNTGSFTAIVEYTISKAQAIAQQEKT